MSWKGFKKAVNRLPHMIQTKAGAAEETVDDEFTFWQEQMQELDQLSNRLHDAAKKYKDAMAAMIKHQESFAKVLLEVYQPIPGRFPGMDSSIQLEVAPIGSHNLTKKDRPLTSEASLNRVQDFLSSSSHITETLLPQLDMIIERQVVKPASDYLELHKNVQKTMVKRDHKKIDYDRHLNQLKKLKTAGDDERKVIKQEATVETALRNYEDVNQLLKTQLPPYIQMRIQLMDPILECMVIFQNYFFVSLVEMLQPLKLIVDMSCSAVDGYNRKKDLGITQINEIRIIKNGYLKRGSRVSQGSFEDAQEFDDESPPKSPHLMPVSSGGPTYLSPPKPMKSGHLSPTSPLPPYSAVPPKVTPRAAPPPPVMPKPTVRRAKVLFDFDAQQEGDLSLKVGQVVEILEMGPDQNAWWTGKLVGTQKKGVFPGNYVQLI